MSEVTLFITFLAGILSFLSPCVLPLVPGFLGYLAGVSSPTDPAYRKKLFLNSVAYVIGFSVVFAALGVLLNTVLSSVGYTVQTWLARLGGLLIIVFGLHLTGLLRIPWLDQEHKIHVKRDHATYTTSFLFGAAFAVGWSPCVGAVLGSVLALAATNPGQSLYLLLAYSLGLGIPFLLAGAFTSQFLGFLKRFKGALKYFNIVVGVFLIVLGILVFTESLSLIANLSFVNNLILQ